MRPTALLTPIVLAAVSGSHGAVASEPAKDAEHEAVERLEAHDGDGWAVGTHDLAARGGRYVYAPSLPGSQACRAAVAGEDTAVVPAECLAGGRCAITALALGSDQITEGMAVEPVRLHVCQQVVALIDVNGVEYSVVQLDRPVAVDR